MGLIAIIVLVAGAVGIYFGAREARGGVGYQTGVHFPTAAGVAPGSQVFMNGVDIGTVSRVKILPDATVDFIMHVSRYRTNIPKNATFSVQSTLSGSPIVAISTPPQTLAANEILPKRVVAVSEQPIGTPPVSLETFFAQSRSLGDRLTGILSKARPYGKPLLATLQSTRANGAATSQELHSTGPVLLASLQSTIMRAKANVAQARTVLQRRDQSKLGTIATAFQRSRSDMQQTANALGTLKQDPQLHSEARAARANLHVALENLAQLSYAMAVIAKSPQTKAELQDAGARFRAILKRI